jgi:hypothetical protein
MAYVWQWLRRAMPKACSAGEGALASIAGE